MPYYNRFYDNARLPQVLSPLHPKTLSSDSMVLTESGGFTSVYTIAFKDGQTVQLEEWAISKMLDQMDTDVKQAMRDNVIPFDISLNDFRDLYLCDYIRQQKEIQNRA